MTSFKQYRLNESIVDFEKETLDPMVFPGDDSPDTPRLNPAIASQILQTVNTFARLGTILKVQIIGSILTHRWTDHSDIDVNILIDKDTATKEDMRLVGELCKLNNGKPAIGTAHPINYFVTFKDTYHEGNWSNIYDPQSGEWLKRTPDETINMNEFMDEFGKRVSKLDMGIGHLRRNIIDYRKLRKFSPQQLRNGATMCRARLRNISNTIYGMEEVKAEMKKLRNAAFARPFSPRELRRIRSKNALPENVLYKLMEYYWYWELLEDLKEAVGNSLAVQDEGDVDKVADAIEKFTDKMEDPQT